MQVEIISIISALYYIPGIIKVYKIDDMDRELQFTVKK